MYTHTYIHIPTHAYTCIPTHTYTYPHSYDETLLLWDTRNMSTPLKEAHLGGGIWRIKWNTDHSDLLATACMHNGFQLVHCHLDSSTEPEVVCDYQQHKSLAYGIDWTPLHSGSDDLTLASCSFYDHSMHLWSASCITWFIVCTYIIILFFESRIVNKIIS